MIKITEHNWETALGEEVEYPTELFQELLHWLFTTKRWMEESFLVEDQVRKVKTAMAEWRAEQALLAAQGDADNQALADRAKAAVAYVDKLLAEAKSE